MLAEAARLWEKAGKGPVIGIATAQAARNVLAAAGVAVAENGSVFLGHLPGQRSALGIRDIGPGTLLVIDEASMMSMPDLAGIIAHAARRGAKVIVAGDQEQLAAVESGGGMRLLAHRLGYVQLTEAVRFTETWERDASLRLRAGDPSALDDYREHGRIRGAEPEQALDDAAQRYVAHYLAGQDVLLMIADHERCREVSRRIREDLVHLGLVDGTGPRARLAHGAAGDLIIARSNDRQLEAGEPGRTLANGDTLRVEKVRLDGTLVVRRAVDCDPVTGRRRWSRPFTWSRYQDADLASAVTAHSAEGHTVTIGLVVVTGAEDRHWLYVALTRGMAANIAIIFTQPSRISDMREGTRPAPQLARNHRIWHDRAALPAPPQAPASPVPGPRHAAGVRGRAGPGQRRAVRGADPGPGARRRRPPRGAERDLAGPGGPAARPCPPPPRLARSGCALPGRHRRAPVPPAARPRGVRQQFFRAASRGHRPICDAGAAPAWTA